MRPFRRGSLLEGTGISSRVADRIQDEFDPVGDAKLVEDVEHIVLYGVFAEGKPLSDLSVSEAISDQVHDLLVAPAQEIRDSEQSIRPDAY